MVSLNPAIRAVTFGLAITLVQVALAVILLAPEGPLSYRYQTLVQHDSYWFENIINRGYNTIVPPISQKMMEVSNVAFFPGYPVFARGLKSLLHLQTANALLLAAQIGAWACWTYFFLFCERWAIPRPAQWLGATTIVAHPAAFFLVAAYSESLFLAALLGFLYWTMNGTPRGQIIGALHGVIMSATRIVGLPCALAPLVVRVVAAKWRGLRDWARWPRTFARTSLVCAVAMLGGLGFFVYGQYRWGQWDIYMKTQEFGWAIEPDYLAVFKPSSYRWLLPSLSNPTEMSQMAMTFGGLMILVMAVLEMLPAARRDGKRSQRLGLFFAAIVIYYISVSGVASVAMESMLRYELCVHALIVLAFLHYLHNVPVRVWLGRVAATIVIALLSAAGVALQGWYVWNFTRGNWVA